MELQLLDYHAIIICPGAVETKILDISQERINMLAKESQYYNTNANKFKEITDKVESKSISPDKIANLAYKISLKKKPKYIYKINRNKDLLLLNILPNRMDNWIMRKMLLPK